MNDDPATWVRDWALIGAGTCAVAPWAAAPLIGPGVVLGYVFAATMLGAVTGGMVGLLLRVGLGRAPERTRVALAAFVVPALGGWGAFVAGAAAAIAVPQMAPIAWVCGSVAALTQLAWITPLYALVARNGWPRLPIVALAPVTAPVAGFLAAFAGFAVAGATL